MEQPKRIDTKTLDGSKLNLEALYQIAPSCFTEAKGEDGELHHVVDFNKLRLLLGDDAVEDAPEVYDFTWVGKRAALHEAAAPINKTLRPCPEESVDWDTTQNLYIEGDNLEVLKLLQNSYMGKVKMIYIDPPYNTGNDFVYHDDFTQSAEEYDEANRDKEGKRYRKNTDSNGRFHSDWCSMMYSRLMVARSLLTEDGTIYISLDDNEIYNLKKICDEVFGESNFISNVIWIKKYGIQNDARYYSTSHDYILAISRNLATYKQNLLPRTSQQDDRYKNVDKDPRGPWKAADFTVPHVSLNRVYPITLPSGRIVTPAEGRCWGASEEDFVKMVKDNRIWFGTKGDSIPAVKKFLSEVKDGVTATTVWHYDEVSHTDKAKKDLASLMQGTFFDYPKPVELIKKILKVSSSKDCIALDFFSGSATTAHAVMQLNAEDGGNRKFIMVQLPEETDEKSEAFKAGYKNICEIGKERIRRAGKKIKEDNPLTTQDLDIGLRVFKCDDSSFKDVAKAPKDYDQKQLDAFVDNIDKERSDLDLLFECMLNWGVELSLPLSSSTVDGCTIHNVNDGDLVACFKGSVTEKVIDAIAKMSPVRVVFRDSSFNEAAQKMNLFELFKQKCDWTDEEVRNNVRVI